MSEGYTIVFLGTGGGRFAMMTQKRRTAGIRILGPQLNAHLDPGPGALVYSVGEGLDPQRLNAVLVSHCHPDHCNDAEVLIEAMTRGGKSKRGTLAASNSVLEGSSSCEPSISKYHQQMPMHTVACKPGTRFNLGKTEASATEARHTDPDAVGFRFKTEFGSFAYTSDTEYFENIGEGYRDVRLLILCVMRPAGEPWKGHMTTGDAVRIVKEARPEQVVLTHLGMKMIFEGPSKEAKLIEQETGVPTTAATDGTRILFEREIRVQTQKGRPDKGLNSFL